MAIDDLSRPPRLRPSQQRSGHDSVSVLGFGNDGAHAPFTTSGWKNSSGPMSQKDIGWGLFDEKQFLRQNWLASLFSANHDSEKSLRTSPSSSFNLSWLWQDFHIFEAPRRRTLASSSNAPQSMLKFCLLCSLWYSASAMTSNSGKSILNQFRYPVTLTFVQFGFVAAYCLLFMSPLIRFTRLRRPTLAIFQSTLPMGLFQVGGHVFSSMAISRIPVSTVHTIKALSPLFTVAAYALMFGVKYSPKTYVSLLPLTIGVMLACSFDVSASNALGLLCAFGSAIVFVSQNIIFKKIMPSTPNGASSASSHKLDKLNLLFYSSCMAFLLMIPIWMYYDLPALLSSADHISHPAHDHGSRHSVIYYFILNGTVHFAQSIIAFIILSSTSPVTYSIASLFKRVAVICIAIIWFNQSVHAIQCIGIAMTFVGLWMYNNAKADVEKGEKKVRRVEAAREMVLPSTRAEHRMMHASDSPALSEAEDSQNEEPISMSSALPRPMFSPVAHHASSHPPHHHHNPNLHIKISPPNFTSPSDLPKDSYPSPPPSNDSPPPTSVPLVSQPTISTNGNTNVRMNRRATVSHGAHRKSHSFDASTIPPTSGAVSVAA